MKKRIILLLSALVVLGGAAVVIFQHKDTLLKKPSRWELKKPSKELKVLRKSVSERVKQAAYGPYVKRENPTPENKLGAGAFDVNAKEGLVALLEMARLADTNNPIDLNYRVEIVNRLMNIKNKEMLPILHECLFDGNPYVRMAAAAGIGALADKSSLEPLMEYVGMVDAEDFRSKTLLGLLTTNQSFAYMQSLMMSLEALGDIGDPRALEVVKRHIGKGLQQHMSGDVIPGVLAKFGEVGLEEAKKDPELYRDVVADIEDPKMATQLITIVNDEKENSAVRRAAAISLAITKDPRAEEVLLAQTKSGDVPDVDIRIGAHKGLIILDKEKYLPNLIAAAKGSGGGYERSDYIDVIVKEQPPNVVPLLEAFLNESNSDIKYSAWSGLLRLTGKDYPVHGIRDRGVIYSIKSTRRQKIEMQLRNEGKIVELNRLDKEWREKDKRLEEKENELKKQGRSSEEIFKVLEEHLQP